MNQPLPGSGIFGWLGRQVGYVKNAIRHPGGVIWERRHTEQAPHPQNPAIQLRRTTIDQALANPGTARSKL